MNKINLGILGCGRIAQKHVNALVKLSGIINLVAVYDVVESLAEDIRSIYENNVIGSKVEVYTNYSDFLNAPNVDAITIATISGYHAQHAIDCLNNDKHVLIEKPMALSTNDANNIILLGKQKSKKVCVSHQNRFIPVFQRVKEAIQANHFGKLIHGSARTLWARDDDYYKKAPWRGTVKMDGGTLMNQCIHNIDLLQWMLGDVEQVSAELDTFIRDIETEDFGALLIRFKNKSIGVVEGSVCVYPKNLEETLSIFGERGTVVIKNGQVETWNFENAFPQPIDDSEGQGHLPLYQDFVCAINDDREPKVNGEEGIKAIEIIEKAYSNR